MLMKSYGVRRIRLAMVFEYIERMRKKGGGEGDEVRRCEIKRGEWREGATADFTHLLLPVLIALIRMRLKIMGSP